MEDWVECQTCQAEFKVVAIATEYIDYCPFCGNPMEQAEEEDLPLTYYEDEDDYE